MFGRRSDATLVRGLSPMRAFMPFISPRRNDSLVLYTLEVDPDPALRFVEARVRRVLVHHPSRRSARAARGRWS